MNSVIVTLWFSMYFTLYFNVFRSFCQLNPCPSFFKLIATRFIDIRTFLGLSNCLSFRTILLHCTITNFWKDRSINFILDVLGKREEKKHKQQLGSERQEWCLYWEDWSKILTFLAPFRFILLEVSPYLRRSSINTLGKHTICFEIIESIVLHFNICWLHGCGCSPSCLTLFLESLAKCL